MAVMPAYSDPWSIVSLAFFLRYPNPYAAHVLSCDVISRTHTESGSLLTTRLILKQGALPRWAPKGIISRAETWVIEESEVDPFGKIVRCRTKNLDHIKVMQVEESVVFKQAGDGYVNLSFLGIHLIRIHSSRRTLQTTEARIVSGFGWGLTKRIENHGLAKFKANVQRVCCSNRPCCDMANLSSTCSVPRGGDPHSGSFATIASAANSNAIIS